MDPLQEVWAWKAQNPFPFWLLTILGSLSLLGHIKIKEQTARTYPRLFALIMLGRDVGVYAGRAFRPLLGLFAPSAVRHLIDAVYPSPEKAAAAAAVAPPGEMKGPLRDPAPSLPDHQGDGGSS